MDFREYVNQESILTTFKISQWVVTDETFCGYFGLLTNLKIQLKNFSFQKSMRYPGNLRDLDIHVESLTKGFMDSLRENAQSL